MKILILFTTIFCLAFACNKKTDFKKMNFGVGQCMALYSGENEIERSQEIIDLYEKSCAIGEINLPLNKVVEGKDYYVFIGVAFNNTVDELQEEMNIDEQNYIIDKTNFKNSENNYHFYFLKRNDRFNCMAIFKDKNQGLTYLINTVSKDSTNTYNLFKQHKEIEQRFNCAK